MRLIPYPTWQVDGDAMVVSGRLVNGAGETVRDLVAMGWVSATRNHFDASAYSKAVEGTEGLHLADDARPRAMTPDEIDAYVRGLLIEQNGLESLVLDA